MLIKADLLTITQDPDIPMDAIILLEQDDGTTPPLGGIRYETRPAAERDPYERLHDTNDPNRDIHVVILKRDPHAEALPTGQALTHNHQKVTLAQREHPQHDDQLEQDAA